MKPGSRDIKTSILITGAELESLQALTGYMAESYGLDGRIDAYRGKRPIGLYRWDLECLIMVVEEGISDSTDEEKRAIFGDYDVESLRSLLTRLTHEYESHYGAWK